MLNNTTFLPTEVISLYSYSTTFTRSNQSEQVHKTNATKIHIGHKYHLQAFSTLLGYECTKN